MTRVTFTLTGASVGSQRRAIPHSGNARMHWAQRAKWNKAWAHQSGWSARMALHGDCAPGWLKAEITITPHTIRQLDADNAHAAVKPIIDGLKGILIADDSPEHIALTVKQQRVKRRSEERVEVEVRQVQEERLSA